MNARTLPASLGYRPALDGLRGIAIALVVTSHIHRDWIGLGIVGVVLFFALSGFLITTLMVEEHRRAGRIEFPAFYRRRALRLFPALTVYLLTVTPLTMWLRPSDDNLASAVSTALYVANWHQALNPSGVGAFGQMWSLGIEEQFYLTWPLLLIGLLAIMRPRRAALVVLTLAAGSALLRLGLASDEAWPILFFSTPTRLDAILLGCGLALWWMPTRRWYVGAALLAVAAILPVGAPQLAFGLGIAAFGSAVVVSAAIQERPGWLRWQPLVRLGRISYGLYLWHGAVFTLVPAPWPVLVVLSLGISVVSWLLVERPFLRMKDRLRQDRRPDAIEAGAGGDRQGRVRGVHQVVAGERDVLV